MATNPDPVLGSLNPAQREAVLHEKGPLLILAGAGSGKTRAITHRIAHLLHLGHRPDDILAITFTNKAAEEMKDRTARLCGIRSPWVSTFHSFCARILRRHIHHVKPYDNSFTIYDTDDVRSVLKEVLEELRTDRGIWTPRSAQAEVSKLKNRHGFDIEPAFGGDYVHGQVLRGIYHLYLERMRERNAVDFDDLLLLTVRLFEEHPQVLERYREQFHHVHIDEYQDTNALQYRIGRLLSAVRRNICITGDPDQSIYKWRGADVSNILNFEEDYPDAKVVRLEQNYRSTKNVLHVANALITRNLLRKPKTLWTENVEGERVRVYRFLDDRVEAAEIAELVKGVLDEGMPAGDIAIFYRINSLSRPIEQQLIYANVPYSIVGGIEYFLRREVKDILGYLRIIDNPRDTGSLRRVINVPARGIGKITLERLEAEARARGRGLLELILERPGGGSTGKKAESGLRAFAEIYRDLASKKGGSVADLVRAVIASTGYVEHLRSEEGEGAEDRIENIWELVNTAHEYETEHEEASVRGFLEMVNLLGDVDRWSRREDRVALMTLHSAKGLEFPLVVIAGVEEGILPLLGADDPDEDIEEERRLLYVGITRARERLYLTHAASRMRFGRIRNAFPSRFLRELELPPDAGIGASPAALELDPETEESLSLDDARSSRSRRASAGESISFEEFEVDGWPSADEGWEEEENAFPVGSRVYHDTYGEGDVVRITGLGQRRRVSVVFEDAGEKQFIVTMAPLRRIR